MHFTRCHGDAKTLSEGHPGAFFDPFESILSLLRGDGSRHFADLIVNAFPTRDDA